jgi:bifunctional ADP-heptose synthase (sugar kinase/adenylyltransferase)|tara:strand:+ start:4930 stop:5673 length:744 start_codon:yes stop_codon:yes gene_type:complete
MAKKVLIIGESCKDIFNYGNCDRLCPDAPVPVFNGTTTTISDGMAMNVLHNLESLGIDCCIITNKNWQLVKKSRYIDNKTNQMLLRTDENDEVLEELDMSLVEKKIKEYDAVIISDYCKGFLSEDTMKKISLLHNNVFLDTKKLLGDWCDDMRYIKINYYEHNRTKHLLDKEIYDRLIITLGSGGCEYKSKTFPVARVEIKDSSGGGDTFIAGFVAEYLKTDDIERAIMFANDCATKVVQKRGVSVV